MNVSQSLSISLALCVALPGCAEQVHAPGPARGRVLFAACTPCHGDDGEGNRQYGAPAIAGLDAWYLQTQLEHFRTGSRGAHPDDAAGLRMRPMVQTLRSDEDLRSVAEYVASLEHAPSPAVLTGGDAARGVEIYATCATCHGPEGAGNEALGAPRLAGANDWYLMTQLTNFRAGIRGADPRDTTGATMRPMAITLADDQAMRDVVAHIATLSAESAR